MHDRPLNPATPHHGLLCFVGVLAAVPLGCGGDGEVPPTAIDSSGGTTDGSLDTTGSSASTATTTVDSATTLDIDTSGSGSSDDGDAGTSASTGEVADGATFLVVGHDEAFGNSRVAEVTVGAAGVSGTVLADLPGEARTIARGTSGWIVVGATASGGPMILHSDDGTTWEDVSPATEFGFFDVVFGNEVFVAAGPSSVASIDGGQHWTNHDFLARAVAWGSCCIDGARFVSVQTSGPDTYVWYSTDGVDWDGSTLYEENLGAIGFGDGRFLAAGIGGSTQISANGGIDWTPGGNVGSGNPTDIAYGAGRFVVVGYGPILAHSTDGLEWTPVPVVEERLRAVAFDETSGIFAIAGEQDTIIASADGVAYVEHTTDLGIGRLSGIASVAN